MPKGKKKSSAFKLVKSLVVLGKKSISSGNHSYIVLGKTLGATKE